MAGHLSRLARLLEGKERARAIKADTSWFETEGSSVVGNAGNPGDDAR